MRVMLCGMMGHWSPLFDIFLNSPCPEADASMWLQKSFNPSTGSTTISTASFVSLLTTSSDINFVSPCSTPQEKRVMWIQTLPDMVQARILSFLAYEHQRFSNKELCKLARVMLNEGSGLDFWVRKAAKQLLGLVSVSNFEWLYHLNLDSQDENMEDKFHSLPDALKDTVEAREAFFPWLPMSPDELDSKISYGVSGAYEDYSLDTTEAEKQEGFDEFMEESEVDEPNFGDKDIDDEVKNRAKILKAKVFNSKSPSDVVELADEICGLCDMRRGKSLEVLSLIEPWSSDDETASVLISHLVDGSEGDELGWPSYVLCSVALPRILTLNQLCSRVLMDAAIQYCKTYQRAAEYALLFPLVLRNGGINNPVCEFITRIVKECFHPAHISAFFQKLFSEEKDAKRLVCLPCHKHLISDELVWTESLFSLIQNVLNHNVHLTQDSVDHLVNQVCEFTVRYSTSLKFGNFLLCLVKKCASVLKPPHKALLTAAVEKTNTIVTKSILSKLGTL